LLILEAMKMENSFLSPRDGIIRYQLFWDARQRTALIEFEKRRIKNKNIETS
jgi:acetyl/propionyl-CoA carboxylase alpha subunit